MFDQKYFDQFLFIIGLNKINTIILNMKKKMYAFSSIYAKTCKIKVVPFSSQYYNLRILLYLNVAKKYMLLHTNPSPGDN